jgi:hypothetical protein
MAKRELVDIEAKLVHETIKALLLDFGKDEPIWLPKSLVEFDEATGIATMPESFAISKGLV